MTNFNFEVIMKISTKWNILFKVFLIYFVCALVFYFVGDEQLKYKYIISSMPEASGSLEELSTNVTVEQSFSVDTETLDAIEVRFSTFGRVNYGEILFTLSDMSGEVLANQSIASESIQDGEIYRWNIVPGIADSSGKSFELTITSACQPGEGPGLYYSSGLSENTLEINEQVREGSLCFSYIGKHFFILGNYYWQFVALGALGIALYFAWNYYRLKQGKLTIYSLLEVVWNRYDFLIKQLVARDFKTKYKRSVLGYLWSFLNPLLTMAVQYIVFSTIFRSGIKNFPVYLLSGIIMFSFFQEAVGQGLIAIVANASLITKVYMPKYIYPVTKVISCSINLFISVIPLLIVTVLTGAPITKAIILLPYALICLLVFCIGMSMLLSTAMVFFRDTQYLWGIISLAWMYATPLFYPADIIPSQFRFIQTLNPIFHYVRFVRTILIDGVSPEPKAYLICGASALLMCLIGGVIFKKYQDKFVLYV